MIRWRSQVSLTRPELQIISRALRCQLTNITTRYARDRMLLLMSLVGVTVLAVKAAW